MRRKKRILGVIMVVVALTIMLLPVSEAGAEPQASDFRMEGSTLVKYRGSDKNVSIPSTVETIGRSAFEDNANIELVVIPNSVKKIDPYAFWGCGNLDTVVLGKGLKEVGDYAFAKCGGLEQMVIPANVISIGIQAFADCANMTDISIPRETTSIHETAFEGCVRLAIHCEEGSTADQYAESFYERQKEMPGYGEAVKDEPGVREPDTGDTDQAPDNDQPAVEYDPVENGNELGSTSVVGNQAVVLMDNTKLNVVTSGREQEAVQPGTGDVLQQSPEGGIPKFAIVDGRLVADQAYYCSMTLGEVTLPEGITEIGEFSFARSSVTSVNLPEGLEKIGYSAFYHCDSLKKVVIPDSVMCVEPKAFSRSGWVEDFLQGKDAGTPAEEAFLIEGGVLVAYRGSTPEVKIPESVRVIAGEAFRNHEEIEQITLPDSLRVIGEGAFENCSGLKQVSFGQNIEEIKDRAFLGSALQKMNLPASVKKLGLKALGDAAVTYEGAEPERTYESSATRLSNADYRVYGTQEEQDPGVTVEGVEEVFGVSPSEHLRRGATLLAEADRNYTLTVKKPEDTGGMEAAFARALQKPVPEDLFCFELTLTDDSGIPLTKLGRQSLSVVLPIPETLLGQELRVFTLDRNGQLEELKADRVQIDGMEAIQFRTDYLSLFGICGAGEAENK